MSFCTKTSEVS